METEFLVLCFFIILKPDGNGLKLTTYSFYQNFTQNDEQVAEVEEKQTEMA